MKCPHAVASQCSPACPVCEGAGNVILTPESAWKLPMVELLEIDHFYLNSELVYLHPLALVDTMLGKGVVVERFYRPSGLHWATRAGRARFSDSAFVPPAGWQAGRAWQDIVVSTPRTLRGNRYNPTREIDYEDWRRAFEDPQIWQRAL